MFRLALAALLASTPAMAAHAACHIVVADDRASTLEIYQHELAHSHGWEHPDQKHGMFGPKKGYQAPKPPAHLVRPNPNCEVQWVSTPEAIRICGSYGCQWFD